MNSRIKSASRLSVVFILVVILSGSILTWFSINNISNLKELTEKRILEEQRELSIRFSSELQNQIEQVTSDFKNGISQAGLHKDSLTKKAAKYDFIIRPFILKNSGGFLYPYFTEIFENQSEPKLSNRFKSVFRKGEQAEFAENNLKVAKENYLLCLRVSAGANDSVKALNALGRISVKLKEFENAIQHYSLIVLNYFNVSDRNGINYIYYALPQLVKITTAGNFEKQLALFEYSFEKMEKGEIPLNFNTKDWLMQSKKSLQEVTVNNLGKFEYLNTLEKNILQQLQFVDEYRIPMSELLKKENPNNYLNAVNDFEVVNSFSGKNQKLLLVNTNFTNPAGFLIDGEKLFEAVIKTGLQSSFEFEYKIEFPTGYNSSPKIDNLVYSSQLNHYFQGQIIQISLRDKNLINDIIKRRSWIYGIATVLLLVAMFLGVVLIIRDIAREKHLAQLQSDFISNVTHELKTPLTSIYMFAEALLLKRVKKESDKDEYLSIIVKESERLKRMIDNILAFSKMEKGKEEYHFVHTNLASIVNTAIHQFDYWFEKEKFDVAVELDENIYAEVDPEKMKQVISNLISNALKYSTNTKKIIIRLYKTKDDINIEVEDQGIGITEEHLPRVFEKFYRVDRKESISGTGLGLTVVKEIIDAHNGKILVTSKIGKGCIFSVILHQ